MPASKKPPRKKGKKPAPASSQRGILWIGGAAILAVLLYMRHKTGGQTSGYLGPTPQRAGTAGFYYYPQDSIQHTVTTPGGAGAPGPPGAAGKPAPVSVLPRGKPKAPPPHHRPPRPHLPRGWRRGGFGPHKPHAPKGYKTVGMGHGYWGFKPLKRRPKPKTHHTMPKHKGLPTERPRGVVNYG